MADSVPRPDFDSVPGTASGDPWIGRVIGDFRIESPLGQGGMGMVYRGRQLSLDRPVALKFLRPGPGIDARSVARFEAEARIAASLNHPNVVGIHTLGNCDGLPFIAMELVPGRNLGHILAERNAAGLGLPGLADCLAIMRQATAGIQAAAELGLVHRDIKPENLMLTPRGMVKVADFGLARDLRAGSVSLTETGVTMGTPLYMSPEQVLGKPADARSDLYSLGMTFHHLLTGKPPLTADSPYLLGMKQVHESPPLVRSLRPDCPEAIELLIRRMIEKRPEDRPASAEEVAQVLSGFGDGRPATDLAAELASSTAFPDFGSTLRTDTGTEVVARRIFDEFATELVPAVPWSPPETVVSRRFLLRWGGLTALAAIAAFGLGRNARRRRAWQKSDSGPVWPPGLNLAEWSRVTKRESAERQYRHALLWAGESDRMAAWLAVPGYFPEDTDWSWRAYAQLALQLVRVSDTLRLVLLRDALRRCGKGLAFEHLAEVIQAALDGAEGNEIGMLETLGVHVKEAMDPALAELTLGILITYRQRSGSDAIVPARVSRLQNQLAEILRIDPKIRPVIFPR